MRVINYESPSKSPRADKKRAYTTIVQKARDQYTTYHGMNRKTTHYTTHSFTQRHQSSNHKTQSEQREENEALTNPGNPEL